MSMKYDKAFFDQSFDRHGTACVKWDCMEARLGEGINPMWVADMDFVCPEEITKAMVERAAHPAYGYTEQTEKATKAMLDFMQRRHGVSLTADEQTANKDYYTALNTYVQEQAVKFIMGDRSLDEFDAFVGELEKMGLNESLKINNDAYARFLSAK